MAPNLTANFTPSLVEVNMDGYQLVNVSITGKELKAGDKFILKNMNDHIATVDWNSTYEVGLGDTESFQGVLKVSGKFLGRTGVMVEMTRGSGKHSITNATLPVVAVKPQRVIDKIFISSVATFVSLIFINFGCAMHWPTVAGVIKRPIGPLIGMCGHFIFLPLVSFGLGFLIFPNDPAMRLGMFFTGVSPGGGASNVWTFILGGNLNLSLAMTSMSTLASFALMPLWLFSLGQVVFKNAHIVVPYQRIGEFVFCLFVPLGIGLCMQRWTPKLATFMVRILKGFSTTLLLCIVVFAIVTNLYIFQLFTWQIIVAGMGIPWLGYSFGYALARICRQPHADALAISIETGIQNTGIAIFLLRYALGQPEADLTTVVPVSVAIMTPIPMTAIYIYQKIMGCMGVSKDEEMRKKSLKKPTPPYQRKLSQESPSSSLPLITPNGTSNAV